MNNSSSYKGYTYPEAAIKFEILLQLVTVASSVNFYYSANISTSSFIFNNFSKSCF